MKSGHISKSIPLPLPKLKNYRHLLFLRQDIPAAQWCVHFVIWLLATKCSLVFKYILRFTGNLKKKLVPDSDYYSLLLSFPLCFYVVSCLLYNCILCDMWKTKQNNNTIWDELGVTCTLFLLHRLLENSRPEWVWTCDSENVDPGISSQRFLDWGYMSVVLGLNAARSNE